MVWRVAVMSVGCDAVIRRQHGGGISWSAPKAIGVIVAVPSTSSSQLQVPQGDHERRASRKQHLQPRAE
ncbi:hypothetical protein PV325_012070 [Microctonus aethiopoides]|nr:hypothetical protein PV326_000744 [Microctonus aethiopoides]KAK0071972.1 hypothetical protein PV325_012070 [Microctonus aethiopoides]